MKLVLFLTYFKHLLAQMTAVEILAIEILPYVLITPDFVCFPVNSLWISFCSLTLNGISIKSGFFVRKTCPLIFASHPILYFAFAFV